MSWVKRRGPSTPPSSSMPVYNPTQHSSQETQNHWQNPPTHDNWYNQQQQYQPPQNQEHTAQPQNYWQQPYNTPVYNPHYGQQQYQNQQATGNYQNNAGYNQQALGNMQYNQHYHQNNMYRNTQDMTNQQFDGDAWNQAWGDEDNSNVQAKAQPSGNSIGQATNLGDAFSNDDSWNWGVDDASSSGLSQQRPQADMQNPFPKIADVTKSSSKPENNSEPSNPAVNQNPLRAIGRRGKLETPQWSTESQVSQESLDDVVQTSESDKSHMLSRNSTISHSPLSAQDFAAGAHSEEVPVLSETFDNLPNFENKEIVSGPKQELLQKLNPTPPPPKKTQTPPLLPLATGADDSKNPYKRTAALSHKTATKFTTSNVVSNDVWQNRFQSSFHSQQVNLETLPDNSEQPDPVPGHQYQKVKPVSSCPDNNEAPINDRNQYLETGQLSEASSQIYAQPNLVSAPDTIDSLPPPGLRRMVPGQLEQNETGGSVGIFPDPYSQVTEVDVRSGANDGLPPPGLRRMIPGQIEQNEAVRNNGAYSDEPPMRLSRMVLGQTETSSNLQMGGVMQNDNTRSQYDPSGPPEGLHRMVPGESSSPESNLRPSRLDENDSETEFQLVQPRSATIGADTPPSVGNIPLAQIGIGVGRAEARGSSGDAARGDKGSRKNVNSSSKESVEQINRRDSIEGQTQETEVSNLTSSVRNLTVGENLTDGHASNTSLPEATARRLSRQESSDSEMDHKKPPRVPRDKRSSERLKRDKDRYSPDNFRDKNYGGRRYKDRKYEEDTDYYSDKEKDRRLQDDRDRDYERKYSSLRKEKDKDRRRKDPRDYRREDYYYDRRRGYGDEYENYEDRGSRPSSRSDSMHESYRRRHEKEPRDRPPVDRERDRYRRRRDPRDMYNPYQGYSYDPYNPYYQQYQYYENLRRTNPQAYAEWYRKYYQQAARQASSYGEDRASVHSGRSSANDELAKDSYSRPFDHTDSSLNIEDATLAAQQLTPAKFSTAHLKASISSGKLLCILPHYPMDGQRALVEVCNLQSFLVNDVEYKELSIFPGPLIKGVTHKKTIIEYCENKIKCACNNQEMVDSDSYILMWQLLILLIRQNGMVVGTDIAELLLKNKNESYPVRPSSALSNRSSTAGDINPTFESTYQSENVGSMQSVLREEEVTSKFRDYLLYGSGQEALEWAMKHGLWGHALFLASKLDKRTYANVMMRFANGLTMNDPLQTLYQLLSGKLPAAVTCVSDEKWGDWRPHLAMILSNSSQRPELNCKAITTLGDTLKNRGSLYAAQFCYLMAEVGFGKHDDVETRLVLLGADHSKPFPTFATNEAIHMTEIYEYACGLNDSDFVIPQFQLYKYLLGTRLADRGLLEKSLAYLENISTYIVSNPTTVHYNFVNNVCNLADKLKFYDPVGEVEDESQFGTILETSRPDHSWLKELRTVKEDFEAGLISHQSEANLQNYQQSNLELESSQSYENSGQDAWQQQYDQQYQQSMAQQQVWQPEQQPVPQVDYQQVDGQQQSQQNEFVQGQFQDQQQNFWPNQQQQPWPDADQFAQENVNQQQHSFYSSNSQVEEPQQPQITMPNQGRLAAYNDEPKLNEGTLKKQMSPAKPKPQTPAQEKTQNTGWFGGIFSKLSLKPKNQMKLPDDKNPKIVWDEAKKRWTNMDEDSNDPANEMKPPPKMSELMPPLPARPVQNLPSAVISAAGAQNAFGTGISTQPSSLPTNNGAVEEISSPKSSQSNMFKMQRARNLKNSYVDIFNPGGKPSGSGPTSLPTSNNYGPAATPQMNFFIPPPVANPNGPVDFLTPGGVPHMAEQQPQ